jgi:transcriptional regulator of acetoin/glycerol metabolism
MMLMTQAIGTSPVWRSAVAAALRVARIERYLHETEWNKAKTARRLGLSRTKLYGRLRQHGLEEPANIGLA